MKDRSDDPLHHEQTLLLQSSTELHFTPCMEGNVIFNLALG